MKFRSDKLLGIMFSASVLAACSGGGGSDGNSTASLGDEVSNRALSQNATLSGAIQTVNDVDWYTIDAKQGDIVSVRVSNNTQRADVDLLVTVYEKDANGDLQRLFADHATEFASLPSEVVVNVYADADKTLYVAVRDLNDDEASSSEIYNITFDIAQPEDGNSTFDSAIEILTDGSCHNDSIGNVGDIDVYTFTLANGQVVEIESTFTPFASGSPVKPSLSLYDQHGNLVRTISQSDNNIYRLTEALAAGKYFVLIKDQGQDDFDSASGISTCVSLLQGVEIAQDDSKDTAQTIINNNGYSISGSLNYSDDEDWSSINVAPLQPSQVRVLSIEFDPGSSNSCDSWLLVEVIDPNDKVIFSKEYSSELLPTTLHVKTDVAGQHFVRVAPVDKQLCHNDDVTGLPYNINITETDIDDAAEITLDGNDSESSADILDPTSNQTLSGKIGYMGDVDWYSITVPNDASHRVLEIFFNSDAPSPLDYYIIVKKDGKTVANYIGDGSDATAAEFKTSFLIPAADGSSNREYQVKISDVRSDEGDLYTNYNIRANLVDVQQIPAAVPINDYSVSDPVYLSESTEQDAVKDAADNVISVNVFGDQRVGAYDNITMVDNIASFTTTDETANTITVNFPWLSGFIDFDGDRDWARLNLPQIYTDAGGVDTTWYADIEVELFSAGSLVEYAWALYRDTNDNGGLREGKSNNDGYFALVGDTDPATTEYYRASPSGSETLWVNNSFVGGAPFYLSLSDVQASETGSQAKNDWGYDNAYFVRVKLVFHPNQERPDE